MVDVAERFSTSASGLLTNATPVESGMEISGERQATQ